jgi:Domain of unknown function (DUF4430)
VLRKSIDGVHESDTVLRVLDHNAKITTRYGGGFVESIDGVAGGDPGGRVHDWFFYVNGVESDKGAADYSLHDGDSIWWDYRDWSAAMRVPAVVGSYPAPFRDGYQGGSHAVAVQCLGGGGACGVVSRRLHDAGAELGATNGDRTQLRVLVGPWTQVRGDAAAGQIAAGPGTSGVFASFRPRDHGYELSALDAGGSAVRELGPATGLVAAVRQGDAAPTWVVTGSDSAGVAAAARILDAGDLRDRYAVAVRRGHTIPVPVQ